LCKLFLYDGKSEEEYYEERTQKRTLKRQKLAETLQQQTYIDKSLLRKTRIDNLNKLINDGRREEEDRHASNSDGNKMLLIPDGVATTAISNEAQLMDKTSSTEITTTTALPKLRSCYVCKQRYRKLHFFYDQLCPDCAKLNYTKRNTTASLDGKIAVVTGARVKIGLQTCLKLLRAGSTVIATIRFPNAAVY
jgi:sulfur relay (sulfurtransferase) DsrF/TusC family protein